MSGTFQTDDYLKIAISACLDAGKAVMEIYKTSFTVEYKTDKSPLTEADKEANKIINSYLQVTDTPIISEESKVLDFEERRSWERCWVVDPVDGTREFLKKNGEFTINIALVDRNIPVYGVIYAPALKRLYFADVRQEKAYKVSLKTNQDTLETILSNKKILIPNRESKAFIKVLTSRSHLNKETAEYIDHLKAKYANIKIERMGSSLKFCVIAEGKADMYPRFGTTMEWDTAAGQAICNSVGCTVSRMEDDLPLNYNKERLLNPDFLVYRKGFKLL